MKIEKKIEKWCKDARFMSFANRRMSLEFTRRLESASLDPVFEELDGAFEYDDRYIVPLVEYLTCRLHIAQLRKDDRASGRSGSMWPWKGITCRLSKKSSRPCWRN